MCVGCRAKAAKTELLRVVAVEVAGVGWQAVPDLRGRLPGRGASLHLDPGCLARAEKRRAFPRALHVAGPLGIDAVRAVVEGSEEK